jgi:hypothetical protein
MDKIVLEIGKKNIILDSLINKKESYEKYSTFYNLFELIISDFNNDTNISKINKKPKNKKTNINNKKNKKTNNNDTINNTDSNLIEILNTTKGFYENIDNKSY